jgi:isopenicillin-N epimerase
MAELSGVEPLLADDPRWFAQMAVLPLPPGTDAPVLKDRLWDDYRIEIPTGHWGDTPCLRISVQGYNTRKDIERLLEAVRRLV